MIALDAKTIACLALTFNHGILPAPYGIGGLIPPGIKNALKWKSAAGINRELKKINTKEFEISIYALLQSSWIMLIRKNLSNVIAFSFDLKQVKIDDSNFNNDNEIAVLIYPEKIDELYSIFSLSSEKESVESFLKDKFILPTFSYDQEDISTRIMNSELEMVFYKREKKYKEYYKTPLVLAGGKIYFNRFGQINNFASNVICADSFEKIVDLAKEYLI